MFFEQMQKAAAANRKPTQVWRAELCPRCGEVLNRDDVRYQLKVGVRMPGWDRPPTLCIEELLDQIAPKEEADG